jgi:hypothetical protein
MRPSILPVPRKKGKAPKKIPQLAVTKFNLLKWLKLLGFALLKTLLGGICSTTSVVQSQSTSVSRFSVNNLELPPKSLAMATI